MLLAIVKAKILAATEFSIILANRRSERLEEVTLRSVSKLTCKASSVFNLSGSKPSELMSPPPLIRPLHNQNKKLSYRRGTAQRTISIEILSTAAQQYEKAGMKRLAIGEMTLKVTNVIGIGAIRQTIYDFLLVFFTAMSLSCTGTEIIC